MEVVTSGHSGAAPLGDAADRDSVVTASFGALDDGSKDAADSIRARAWEAAASGHRGGSGSKDSATTSSSGVREQRCLQAKKEERGAEVLARTWDGGSGSGGLR